MSLLQIAIDLGCLAVGVAIGYYLGKRHNRKLDIIDPENAPHKTNKANVKNVVGALLFVMAIFIVVSTSQTNDETKRVADEQVRIAQIQGECNDEFFRVLGERTKITADDNELNRSDARALQQLVSEIFSVPGEFNPSVVADAGARYQQIIKANNAQREQNSIERAANPYPEPRCGN